MPADSHVLSTRSVKTWVEKLDGSRQPSCFRRSCLVAREFAWMDAERDSLFSPASNAIVPRLLPTMCFEMMDNGDSSIDGKDAFFDGETTDTYQNQLPVGCWADHSTRPRQSAPWSA